jgi:hypothetical protein
MRCHHNLEESRRLSRRRRLTQRSQGAAVPHDRTRRRQADTHRLPQANAYARRLPHRRRRRCPQRFAETWSAVRAVRRSLLWTMPWHYAPCAQVTGGLLPGSGLHPLSGSVPIVSGCCSNQVLSPEGCGRGFLAKNFSCASRSTCVSSGSRLLSGRTRTTSDFDSASAPGIGSSGAVPFRQCARVFSQKMIAGILPAFAAANR